MKPGSPFDSPDQALLLRRRSEASRRKDIPKAVQDLVERFERDRDVFPAGSHKEEQLRRTKTPHERESLERTIAATDRKGETLRFAQGDPVGRIDALVYELYGLTKEEIRIVEKRGDE